nr:MAG TPA: hypothetical protein [Caudoviricetes sp.]
MDIISCFLSIFVPKVLRSLPHETMYSFLYQLFLSCDILNH